MKTNFLKSNFIIARKIAFLSIILAVSPLYMHGTIAFAYDAAGNRIKRELVISQMNMAPGQTAGVDQNFYDSIGEKSVTLTSDGSGIVQISINNLEDEDYGHVWVHTVSGINVLDKEIAKGNVSIDLTGQPKGVYILNVKVNGNQTSWKITKK